MKRYKVKHFRSRIYNPIRGKILKAVAIIAAVTAIFAIGWFAYEPLMEAINDRNKEIIEQEPVPEKPQEPAYEPLPEEFLEKETVAVTVPEEILYNALDYYEFIKSFGDEITAVVLDMKTKTGTVTYNSQQVSVINAGAVSENAVELKSRIKTAQKLGLDVILRIYAFEDSTAPYNAVDMAIRYESEEGLLWLDDSVDNGGKPWLNPYSDTAQKYILDIVYDAIDYDADAVILEGVRFPKNGDLDYAYFGAGAEGVSREEILTQFAKRIYSGAVVTDTNIVIGYNAYENFTAPDVYGGSPLVFNGDGYAPFIDLNAFVGQKFSSDFYYKNMPEELGELFTKVYSTLGDVSELKMLPVISCEGFTKAQMAEVLPLLKTNGAVGYILVYNEPYFTGVPEEPLPEEDPNVPQQPAVTPPAQQQPQPPTQPVQPTQPQEPDEPEYNYDPEEWEDAEKPGVVVKDYLTGEGL